MWLNRYTSTTFSASEILKKEDDYFGHSKLIYRVFHCRRTFADDVIYECKDGGTSFPIFAPYSSECWNILHFSSLLSSRYGILSFQTAPVEPLCENNFLFKFIWYPLQIPLPISLAVLFNISPIAIFIY